MGSKSVIFLRVIAAMGGLVALFFLLANTDSGKQLFQKRVAFQQAIGGVGLGSTLVPAWNFSDFDPRLQKSPADRVFPVPSGYSYSPDRLSMVSSFNGQGTQEFQKR